MSRPIRGGSQVVPRADARDEECHRVVHSLRQGLAVQLAPPRPMIPERRLAHRGRPPPQAPAGPQLELLDAGTELDELLGCQRRAGLMVLICRWVF
jgi:hypothetical protein